MSLLFTTFAIEKNVFERHLWKLYNNFPSLIWAGSKRTFNTLWLEKVGSSTCAKGKTSLVTIFRLYMCYLVFTTCFNMVSKESLSHFPYTHMLPMRITNLTRNHIFIPQLSHNVEVIVPTNHMIYLFILYFYIFLTLTDQRIGWNSYVSIVR